MTQARVFYARRNDDGRMYDPAYDGNWPLDADHYTLAASVLQDGPLADGDACEHAWSSTNSVDHPWWQSAHVVRHIDSAEARSMCVGDVVVLPNGNAYRCARAGWMPL